MSLKNTAIEAGAGCGKTTRITGDIIQGLKEGQFEIDKIVVITFTRKAAGELKSRISLELQKLIGKGDLRIEEQIKNIGNARISTIHSFCESLLKERPLEAGIDPGSKVIDETEQDEFLEKIYDEWLKEKLETHQSFFRKLLLEMGVELTPPDYSFNSTDHSFLGIIRRALEYREMELFVPEEPEDVSSILNKFITECNGYLAGLEEGTLKNHFQDYIQVLQAASKGNPADYVDALKKYKPGNKGGASVKELRESWKDTCGLHVEQLEYSIRFPELLVLYDEANNLINDFIDFYRQSMKAQGLMDFNEIMVQTEQLLAENKEVREYFKRKFDFIFVDEFQDTDPLQTGILFYLAEKPGQFADNWKTVELDDNKLYVVGDPKQSIYRFRRADIEIYTAAMEKIAGGGKEFLSVNYRSTPEIIDWVNDFFTDRIKKPESGTYQADYVALEHFKKPGGEVLIVTPEGVSEETEKQKKDDARVDEAMLTAKWIKQFVAEGNYQYGDILVLFRKKANMQLTTEYLEELDIPYEMIGARSYFDRAEIRDISNLLTVLANPLDQISLAATLKGPFYSLSDKDLYTWRLSGGRIDYQGMDEDQTHQTGKALAELNGLHKRSRNQDAAKTVTDLLEEKGVLASYMATYRGRKKVLNLIKAIELLKSYGKIPFCMAAQAFSEKVEQNAEMADFSPKTGNTNAVQLMTIHKAKGLGSKVLYLADSTSGAEMGNEVFIDNASKRLIYRVKTGYETAEFKGWKEEDKKREEAEIERLRYVAATRAEEVLVINRVPGNKFDETFSFPLHELCPPTRTEAIDISGMSLNPGRLTGKPKPLRNLQLEEEFNDLQKRTSQAVANASQPSLNIQSPSLVESRETDIKVNVVFNPDSADFHIEGVSAATIGTLAHKLLQLDPTDLKIAADTLVKNEQIKLDPLELVDIVKSMQKKELTQRVQKAKTVLREVPIKYKGTDDVHYDGSIDLLFKEKDGWVLVDYKTITISDQERADQVKEKYTGQLQVYADGLRQMGLKVKDCLIVSR